MLVDVTSKLALAAFVVVFRRRRGPSGCAPCRNIMDRIWATSAVAHIKKGARGGHWVLSTTRTCSCTFSPKYYALGACGD